MDHSHWQLVKGIAILLILLDLYIAFRVVGDSLPF